MRLLKSGKDLVLPSNSDYIFDKLKDLERLVPYLYPKLGGEWLLIMMDMNIKDLKYILNDIDVPEYIDLVCTVKVDTYKEFCKQYPAYMIEPKTKMEMFEEFIATVDISIEYKAYYALYSRAHGDVNKIRELIDDILEIFPDIKEIDIACVDRVIPKENIVYASEVVLAMFLNGNPLLQKKGSMYSKYYYIDPNKLLWQLIDSLGHKYSFYAMRKQVINLYKESKKYMKNDETKYTELFGILDIFKITTAYIMFENCNYMQMITIFKVVRGDEDCVNLFEDTLHKSIEKCNSNGRKK